ncbi:MAG: 6-bladed beta-propeller [Tannerellaceae bacterium]|jgi:TonB family protein|nr:6-bladed beta-propeller [Tannerellaceae bacterium]
MTLTFCNSRTGENGENKLEKLPVIAVKSTNQQGNAVISCDYSLIKDTIDMELSSLVSGFDAICLSNQDEALVTEGNLTVSENYIGIYSSRAGEYKLFSRKGDFITNISSRGPGAHEFVISIYDSYIDEAANRIYILPMRAGNILVFDLEGNIQGQIRLAYNAPKGRLVVNTSKKEVIIMALPFKDGIPSVIWKQDFDGNIIQEVPAAQYAVEPDFSNEVDRGLNTGYMDFSIFKWGAAADSLYHYDEDKNELNPVFTVRFPGEPLMHEYIELPGCYLVRMIPEGRPASYPLIYVDKNTLKGAFIRLNVDFLGGIRGSDWIDFRNGYYITNNYAYSLKEEIENKLKDQDVDANSRERLELINNSITEDSNNIFFIGRLKTAMSSPAIVDNDINIYLQEASPDKENISKDSDQASSSDEDRVYGLKTDDLKEIKIGYPEGDFKEYFRTNNLYKDWDSNDKKEVTVVLIIEKDGSASNVRAVTPSGVEKLDNEAIRLIQNMKFVPTVTLKGKPVRSRYFMPVYFPPQ